jgi:hypothetical protein
MGPIDGAGYPGTYLHFVLRVGTKKRENERTTEERQEMT